MKRVLVERQSALVDLSSFLLSVIKNLQNILGGEVKGLRHRHKNYLGSILFSRVKDQIMAADADR